MQYEVTFAFDDSRGDAGAHRAYFSALEKYSLTMGSGHPDGTSSVIVSDFSILNLVNLVRDLKQEGIKLIRFREL